MRLISIFFFLACFANTLSGQPGVEQEPLKDLHWKVKNLLSMQLPSSLPDSMSGTVFRKAYSIRYKPDGTGGYFIEVPELRRTVERDSTFGAGKYSFTLASLDTEKIGIVSSPDGQFLALRLPAKPELTFLHSPGGREPDRQVAALTLGWYEANQSNTLQRLLVMLQQLFDQLLRSK